MYCFKNQITDLEDKVAENTQSGGIKKRKILPLATAWMDLEDIMLSEISQSEKNK